ncbi:MAG: hypothetical protein ACJ79S_05740 [Gemmatimonadaceae bacterium]
MSSIDIPRRRRALLVVALIGFATSLATGCSRGEASPAAGDSAGAPHAAEESAHLHRPGYVVDSVLPPEEALRRFREGLSPVARLDGGARSRDGLVADFARAVERGDSVALRRLEISRAEFAYLFYPSSIYTRPPYREQPEIVWILQRAKGGSGYRRLVQRFAGRPLGYRGYRCALEPRIQGENRLWGECTVAYRNAHGDSVTTRLFGAILERGGRFKFINYANDL